MFPQGQYSHFSLSQEFQLTTFRAGWCLSAVTLTLSPRWFQLPVKLSPVVTLFLSPRGLISIANLSCLLVLIHCNLVTLSSEVSVAFFQVLTVQSN